MTSELDPSILTPHELSKLNKKALIENLTVLQGKYNVQSKKYDKAKTIIRENKKTTEAASANTGLIPKPPGRRSRDFNIFDAMQAPGKVKVSKATYKSLINYIHFAVMASNIDMTLPLKDQETVEVVKVVASIREQYPFIAKYFNAWPVFLLMRQFLNNHRGNFHAKKAANEATPATAGPALVTTAPDLDGAENSSGNDGENRNEGEDHNEGEGESDVVISDIDD